MDNLWTILSFTLFFTLYATSSHFPFLITGATAHSWPGHLHLRVFLEHKQRRATVSRTPLDK